MTNREIVEALERIQDLLTASVTNNGRPEYYQEYKELTSFLYDQVEGIREAMPPFVRRCRELGQFWHYIKTEEDLPSYASRRLFVADAFRPLIESFRNGTSTAAQKFFPKGSDHDVYMHIREILQRAQTSLLIIDGYMDSTIYTVMKTLTGSLNVRLLTSKVPGDFSLEGKKFAKQHSFNVEIRSTRDFHDRFILVDNKECYFLGASIKDAGAKGFSIVPLRDVPVVKFFIDCAGSVWTGATPLP